MQVNIIVISGLVIWVLALTVGVIYILYKASKLTREVKKGNLIKILENVLASEIKNSKEVALLKKQLAEIQEKGELHVQKMHLLRFNPFEELGGEHSFCLAILDGMESGVVLTGLHTRERTRIYVKSIRKGKSEVELSKEELKALKGALKQN
ncbi:MAG: hypothetical protein US53_C0056G0003 [Candidatus Woesebacteria bacterium GW2011_GWA1_37_7]|uniref:DUF4446 domain-containing protein n=1 Tax=Candidatus Woesebacteria bacterium GW2011_GWA1_37_7 TaxID=1618545 RepID=A0A0G0GZF1_9BACT|nr:MAG: hypothetical protein US53_C0056G0003 [Candidatus Woesebacteria bacterium GW2011_GWA1_37_7]